MSGLFTPCCIRALGFALTFLHDVKNQLAIRQSGMLLFGRKIAVCLGFSCLSIFADIYRDKRSEDLYI